MSRRFAITPANPALLLLLLAAVLLGPGSRAWGQGARNKDYPPPPAGQSPPPGTVLPGDKGSAEEPGSKGKEKQKEPHTPLPPPEIPGTARPLPAKLPESIPAFPALQLLGGTPQFSVTVHETDPPITLDPGKGFAHGAFWGVDWVGEYLRAGYFRMLYRHDLPNGTRIKGDPADFLSFESNAFWTHLGFRPATSLYLGAGAGLQLRRVRYELTDRDTERATEETVYSTGLLLEYAIGLPFVAQLRYVHDLPGKHLEADGPLILIAYTVPL